MDRHPKWTPVEPGTVIPAGQPYRIEYGNARHAFASEFLDEQDYSIPHGFAHNKAFVDSSWRPPLVLPTEPTWGIAVYTFGGNRSERFARYGNEFVADSGHRVLVHELLDFIPLTDEQVARIEQAR